MNLFQSPIIEMKRLFLQKDNRCSVTMSLAEGGYCRKQSLDPEDPRCAQVILTGNFVFVSIKIQTIIEL